MTTARTCLAAMLAGVLVSAGCGHGARRDHVAATSSATPSPSLANASAGTVEVTDGWLRQPPGAKMTAGYLTMRNTDTHADELTTLSSPAATRVQLHQTVQKSSGAETMKQVRLPYRLPAGQRAVLQTGGMHLMLTGLRHHYRPGQQVPVRMTFAHAGAITIRLPVLTRQQEPRHSTPP